MTLSDTLQTTLNGQTVMLAKFGDVAGDFAVNLVIAALILAATFWASGWAAKLVRKAIQQLPRARHDETLKDFASSFVRYAVVVAGLVAVLRRLGVETASIVTVLGAASLAIGLALQGALSNVAAGVMILMFRPYRVGDLVHIAGKLGTVRHLDLFVTELRDPNNLKVIVPNGKAFGADPVVNYTAISKRRIELTFGIGYGDDIGKALEIAKRCATSHPRILQDPPVWCQPMELTGSTVNIVLRAWTLPEVYWDTRSELLRAVKEAYDAEGVSLPPPIQMSVEAPPSTLQLSSPAKDPVRSPYDSASGRPV